MSDIHATLARRRRGQCAWTWHWEDVDLRCDAPAIPGGHLCADHTIEKAGRKR